MDGVKAGTASIMCSYNRVNNSYGCQNSKLLNGILKTELEFEGFVISDWNAQYGGVAGALAGMDMVMPNGSFWSGSLLEGVKNGTVPEERVTDMATRCDKPAFCFMKRLEWYGMLILQAGSSLGGILLAKINPTSPNPESASTISACLIRWSMLVSQKPIPSCSKVPSQATSSSRMSTTPFP